MRRPFTRLPCLRVYRVYTRCQTRKGSKTEMAVWLRVVEVASTQPASLNLVFHVVSLENISQKSCHCPEIEQGVD